MLQAPPLKKGKLHCAGNGFTCNSYPRATPDIVKAKLKLAGTPSHQPRRDWWEAQVHLYGITCGNTVEAMKTALKRQLDSGDLRVSESMERLEESYNKRYHKENEALQARAAKREPYHRCSRTEVQLYESDHSRLFWELRLLGGVKGLSGLDSRQRKSIHKEAERQLYFSKTSAPGEILLVGAKQDVERELHRLDAEDRAKNKELIAKREEQRIMEQQEVDRLHLETIQTGNTDIAGKWVLTSDMRYDRDFHPMGIARPVDESMWITGEDEVWHLDWIALGSDEKTFEWTKTDGVAGYDFDYNSHKGTGTITFDSPYLFKGKGRWGTFTGRKVGNEISTTNEECIAKCDKATKDILAMQHRWDCWDSKGTSKKDIMKELYSQ